MAIYTAHLPRSGAAEHAVFVRDGFSMAAFAFGPLWLFARGAWMSGSALLATMLTSSSLLIALGLNETSLVGLLFLFMLLIGLEGSSLLRLDLSWRGYRLAGVATGVKPEEAEARFFASLLSASPPVFSQTLNEGPSALANAPRSAIIGSFPFPPGTRPGS